MAYLRAIWAERLKMKRTLALWLAPIAPLVIVGLEMALILDRAEYFTPGNGLTTWENYGQQIVLLWGLMMLPLFITLETTLLSNLEHSNQQWKHLFALPLPRSAVYVAKQISGMALIALSMVALYGWIVLTGLLLSVLLPGLGFEEPIPWLTFARYVGISYLAGCLLISIHTWVGLRWHGFVVPIAVGIAAVVVSLFIFQSEYSEWFPWTVPGMALAAQRNGITLWPQLIASGVGTLIVALFGAWNVCRRDVL
ncbi:MAG: ABC transporter permease subunit [Chloroflexi bacterium]|jgi:hypothetical protein|nr:ABC transporter permease subunit [Chloroflexota bacterium]